MSAGDLTSHEYQSLPNESNKEQYGGNVLEFSPPSVTIYSNSRYYHGKEFCPILVRTKLILNSILMKGNAPS